MIITRPSGMMMRDWADQIVLDLDSYGSFGKLNDENWQDWGVQFLNNSTLGKNLPNPYAYENWAEWAERLCQILT